LTVGADVSLVVADPGADHRLASALELVAPGVDELILVQGSTGRIEPGAVQRAGFAAARNNCIVMAGPDADLSVIGRFVEALRSGCAALIGPEERRRVVSSREPQPYRENGARR
jgi:hypothetical protein